MNTDQLLFFYDELEKIAYGEVQHRGLAGVTANKMKAKGDIRKTIIGGSLKTDSSLLRHPWNPITDPLHAFAGSQSKEQIGRSVAAKQTAAVDDIASSIAGGRGRQGIRGYLKSGPRGVRGLENLGEAQHTLMDIGSHYEKPVAQGGATRLRKVLPQTGYGGGIVGGREHLNVEKIMKTRGAGGIADIDDLSPSTSRADRASVGRAKGFGRSSRGKVEAALMSNHGMSADEAAKAATHFFEKGTFSPASKRIGSLSRDVNYMRGEASRAGQALKQVGRRLLRR
jgi:hypothetical protein